MDFAKFIPPVDEAAISARIEAWRQKRRERSAMDLFNPTNLGHWLDLCRAASVPCVTADEIARGAVDDVMAFEDNPQPAGFVDFFTKVGREMAERGDGWMVRWSCCSCADIKCELSQGRCEWQESFARLEICDLRAFDIVADYPEDTIAAYARPWVKAAILDSYPVEYRVYVTDNQINGISNYYPQRPLPNDAQTLHDIWHCLGQAARLLAKQTKPLNCPPLDGHWDTAKNHWTADFIRTTDGEILFLEGGPPHSPDGGAHPCCFMGRAPSGIALAATDDGLDMMGLAQRAKGERP